MNNQKSIQLQSLETGWGQYYFWMWLGSRCSTKDSLSVPGYCRWSSHEPITSRPCSLVVSYHLPFNLTENISLRCAIVCVSVCFIFVFVEFVFGGHFSVKMTVYRPTLTVITMTICWWNVKCNCYWSVFRRRDLKGFVVAWLRRLFRHDSQELFPWFALQDRDDTERRGQ